MLTREEIRRLFDLAELENEQEIRTKNLLRKEELSVEEKAKRLEFTIEHLNPRALIAIHQTNQFPENGILRPTGHFLLNMFNSSNSKKIIEDLQLKYPRITIHFTLNYPVKGVVARGQWIEWQGKYAVLIPVEDIINRIICLHPVDTWIIGALELLSSAEILMNEEEYFRQAEVWHASAGRAKIIPFPNNLTTHKAVEARIRKKGYNLTEGGDHNWFGISDLGDIVDFINNSPYLSPKEKDKLIRLCVTKGFASWTKVFEELAEKFKKISKPHYYTDWRRIEVFAEEVYGFLFEPYTHEATSYSKDILHKLEGLEYSAKKYRDEITTLLASKTYTHPHERQYLNELIGTLNKISTFLSGIINKIKLEHKEHQTWGEFLRQERII